MARLLPLSQSYTRYLPSFGLETLRRYYKRGSRTTGAPVNLGSADESRLTGERERVFLIMTNVPTAPCKPHEYRCLLRSHFDKTYEFG